MDLVGSPLRTLNIPMVRVRFCIVWMMHLVTVSTQTPPCCVPLVDIGVTTLECKSVCVCKQNGASLPKRRQQARVHPSTICSGQETEKTRVAMTDERIRKMWYNIPHLSAIRMGVFCDMNWI